MNVPKAVIKTVENQRSVSLIFGLFGCSLLGGCSLFGEGSGVSNGSDPARGVLPLLDRSSLMRLGDGCVDALSLEAIQCCEHRLGLADEVFNWLIQPISANAKPRTHGAVRCR